MAQETVSPGEPARPVPYSHNRRWKLIANSSWNVLVFILIVIVFGLVAATGVPVNPQFLTERAIVDMLPLALIAMPLILLMASGELDLSLGATIGLSAIIAANTMKGGGSLIAAAGVCVALGLIIGLVHGALVGAARFSGALVTLATASLMGGISFLVAGARGIVLPNLEAGSALLPILGCVLVFLMTVATIVLIYFTPFGRRPLRGDPPEPVIRRMLYVGLPYVVGALMAAVAGLILIDHERVAFTDIYTRYETLVLIAVLIGGTPLGLGISDGFGALLGVVFTGGLSQMYFLLGPSSSRTSTLFNSLVLAVAVLLAHAYHGAVGWLYRRRKAPPQAPAQQAEQAPS